MRILNSVPDSVLWLLADAKVTIENLKFEAASRGVDPSRLVFAERVSPSEHLARHKAADLFLDTLPYNAHTTASDALWSGLPILTLIGESFPARVCASILNAIGMPELITDSTTSYEAMAIKIASDPKLLEELKLKVQKNRLTKPLFNTAQFTTDLERLYEKAYFEYQANLQ